MGIPGPWDIVLVAVAGLLVWALLAWAHLRFWVAHLRLVLPYARVHTMRAPDGGRFELRQITDVACTEERPPVLLVHGICANHRNQDIHPNHSLARYLAEQGRDVWLLTLRSGVRRGVHDFRAPMGFDSMVRYDVPLAISYVLESTGAAAVDYVAFSMGGMLLYASLGNTVDRAQVRRAVFIGSPGRVIPPHKVPKLLGRIPRSWVPILPSGLGARAFAFLSEWFKTPLHRMILNPTNMSSGITRLALVDCVEDVPGELLADFIAWATSDGIVRIAGKDVLEGVQQARQPALFLAGAADRIGQATAVRAAFDAWGSATGSSDKQFVLMGAADGASADYGHGDLAMGTHAPKDVFPRIGAFLDEVRPRQISNASPRDQVEAPTCI